MDVIKDGWYDWRCPSGLMVREAKLDGRQVTLLTRPLKKDRAALICFSLNGTFCVDAEIVAPVSTVCGNRHPATSPQHSAVSHATIELTRQGVDFTSPRLAPGTFELTSEFVGLRMDMAPKR